MDNAQFQIWFATQTAIAGDKFAECDTAGDDLADLFAAADAIMASDLYAE